MLGKSRHFEAVLETHTKRYGDGWQDSSREHAGIVLEFDWANNYKPELKKWHLLPRAMKHNHSIGFTLWWLGREISINLEGWK